MSDQPFVSVVIPMRNERGWIERSLAAVLAQDYPRDRFEVLIADGQSDDGSEQYLRRIAEKDPRVRVLSNPGRIVPVGLNIAIRAARGEIIARVDAHTLIAPDYLRRGVEILQRSGADGVGGPMVAIGGGVVGDAVARAMASRFGIGAAFHFEEREGDADTVYMGMWPRRLFSRVGLFDEELVRDQDDEMSYRIRKCGGRLILAPAMRSQYQNRQSWRRLARQFYQYGYWKVRVLQKHPRQMSVRHFLPPLFDAGLILSLAVAPVWPAMIGAAVVALLLYGSMLAVVSTAEGSGLTGRLRLALALAIIHHAWAIGFLSGLLRFSARWRSIGERDAPRLAATRRNRAEE